MTDAGEVDSGVVDAGPRDAGAPLWPVGATRVEATRRGGFPAAYCDTDGGTIDGSTYVLTLPEGRVAYSVCYGYTLPKSFASGEIVLDAGQLSRLEDSLRALTRSDNRLLGADYPVYVLLLTTPTGQLRYEDDFYAHQNHPDTTYVEEAAPVFVLLDEFAGIRW